jgi:hypothetical protein
MRTLTVIGPPPSRRDVEACVPALTAACQQPGVEPWARQSMAGRLGRPVTPLGVAGWTTCIGRTAVSTPLGCMHLSFPKICHKEKSMACGGLPHFWASRLNEQ